MHSIRVCSPGVEDKAGSVAAAGEHFQPLVECGPLWLEEDVPFLKQAEAALLAGGVCSEAFFLFCCLGLSSEGRCGSGRMWGDGGKAGSF